MNNSKYNPAYIGPRKDILKIIPEGTKRVLDIGCSVGSLGEQIKNRFNSVVVGVEVNEEMATEAKKKLDKVLVLDVESVNFNKSQFDNSFDLIIFGDVLEHLKNPWKVLKNSTNILSDSGIIIASIPNVKHYSTFYNLLIKNQWPYNERGVHDRTHVRFFTLKNIKKLFAQAGLKIIKIKRKYRIIEKPAKINAISKVFALPLIKSFITHQYLIVAEKE